MTTSMPKRLRRLREAKRLSVAEVARYLGIAASTYREWEQGRQIRGEPYLRLAEVFGVGLSELFDDDAGKTAILTDLEEIEIRIRKLRLKL